MNELLQEVKQAILNASQLCSILQNASTYATNITREAEEKLKAVTALENKVEEKEKGLISREIKVAGIENLAALEESGKALAKKNQIESDRLEHYRTAFKDESEKSLKELGQKMAKIADDNLLLDRGWKDLRAKESSYKAEIEADILKRFKK